MESTYRTIRIVSIPPGEAPTWVRERWVGLELPLATSASKPSDRLSVGLLDPHTGYFGALMAWMLGRANLHRGYVVEARVAFSVLEHVAPDAAQWWRINTPHLWEAGRLLLFNEEVCEVFESPR